jgi:hypothetical protein
MEIDKRRNVAIEHKTLKWIKVNNAPPSPLKGSPLRIPLANGMIVTSFS